MNRIRYTAHAKQRMVERRIDIFDLECKVARPPILNQIKTRCEGHADQVRRDGEYVYWHRRRKPPKIRQ